MLASQNPPSYIYMALWFKNYTVVYYKSYDDYHFISGQKFGHGYSTWPIISANVWGGEDYFSQPKSFLFWPFL